MSSLEENLNQELQKQKNELVKTNILIAGATGVGKSSLINLIFGKKLAQSGNGKPVTRGLNKFEKDDIPVVIYDSEGYEISSSQDGLSNFDKSIKPEIEKLNKKELKEQIHLVWYCISIANHRVTEYDLKTIKYFLDNNMKTAIVFTKCDIDTPDAKVENEFKMIIQQEFPNIEFFATSDQEELKLDLEKLMLWSYDSLDDERLRKSFVSAQLNSIELKRKEAYRIVTIAFGTTATSAGLNPIPISDSLVILPQQLAMSVAIANIFKFDSIKEGIESLVKSQIISLAGKQVAASLLKLIPIAGQVINAAVAGTLTFALGASLIEIYSKAYEEYLKTGKLPVWAELFSSEHFAYIFKRFYEQKSKETK